jgi:hypothetical protein
LPETSVWSFAGSEEAKGKELKAKGKEEHVTVSTLLLALGTSNAVAL